MRHGSFAFAALALLCASPAFGQDSEGAAEIGLRTGVGIVFGKANDDMDGDLNDGVEAAIPFWLDIGYRFVPELFVGLYGSYALGFVGDALGPNCDEAGVDCSVGIIRFGLQAHYHIMPAETVDPFIGVGFGLEWLNFGFESGGMEISSTGFGMEFLNLQFGLDITVTPSLYVGPFAAFTLGQYTQASVDCSGATCSDGFGADMDIEDKALHGWVFLGGRVAYTP